MYRRFKCQDPAEKIDRDLNASLNIKAEGLKQIGWATPDSKPVDTCQTLNHTAQSKVDEAGKNVCV